MARDELVAVAVGEPVAELAVEGAQPVREPLGLRTAIELFADPLGDRGVPDRIEPDVGVDVVLLLAADPCRNRVEEIDPVCRRGVDRVLEGRLEALAEVEDEVGVRRSCVTSLPESSRSCGSTPGGVRFRTSTPVPPIC